MIRSTSTRNTGALATAAWCAEHGLVPKDNLWFVEVVFTAGTAKLTLEVYAAEWGFSVHHADRVSWIRVTDIPFVHGRDDFALLSAATGLSQLRRVFDAARTEHGLAFARETADVRTNLDDALPAIRRWLAAL